MDPGQLCVFLAWTRARAWLVQEHDNGTVTWEASANPISVGTRAWVDQIEASPRAAPSPAHPNRSSGGAHDRGLARRTFSFGRKPADRSVGVAAPEDQPASDLLMQRKRAQKHIVDRMIGIQATPFKCGPPGCGSAARPDAISTLGRPRTWLLWGLQQCDGQGPMRTCHLMTL